MPFVYSTSSCSAFYGTYIPSPATAHAHKIEKKVLIYGKANVAPLRDSKTTITFATPLGAVTKVSDQDLEFLMTVPAFIKHMKAGFLKVEKSNKPIEKVVSEGMQKKDGSAPITPKDKEYLREAVPVMNPQV
jgi:hypothetical protein